MLLAVTLRHFVHPFQHEGYTTIRGWNRTKRGDAAVKGKGEKNMGLDVSHNAFSGAYSSFNCFRQAVANAIGGSFPPHEKDVHEDGTKLDPRMWYWGDGYTPSTHPGLSVFLQHSDCDGEISSDDCSKVANELEALLPQLDAMGIGFGHIERGGGYGAVARKFIAGCRNAAKSGEPLVFG